MHSSVQSAPTDIDAMAQEQLDNAATRIQAHVRGYLTRKQIQSLSFFVVSLAENFLQRKMKRRVKYKRLRSATCDDRHRVSSFLMTFSAENAACLHEISHFSSVLSRGNHQCFNDGADGLRRVGGENRQFVAFVH